MRTPRLAVLLSVAALLLTTAAPAHARTVEVTDPVGDGLKGRRLDITGFTLRNRDHALVAEVAFVRVAAGDLGIHVQARGEDRAQGALVFSKHRPDRGDTNRVVTWDGDEVVRRECGGLRVTWDHEADTAAVRLPSSCFLDGNYGAVRVRLITEIGSDADYAPKGTSDSEGPYGESPRWLWTSWVPRG